MADLAADTLASPTQSQSIADDDFADSPSSSKEKATRIYRACVHCRQRKSKCQLDAGDRPGLPPCRRCVREGRDCVLAGSRRGGRRPKKHQSTGTASLPSTSGTHASALDSFDPDHARRDGTVSEHRWTGSWDANKNRAPSVPQFISNVQSESVESTIDQADIQNPSDALEILAQVAGGEHSNSSSAPPRSVPQDDENGDGRRRSLFQDFPPFTDGSISYQDIIGLFDRYHQKFHPFFPIVPERWFDPKNLGLMSSTEPHLFAAILTVAAADTNSTVYRACSIHIRGLIAELIYGGDGDVEAVEALLILSEWATIWQPTTARSSKVLEDRYAWMLVGIAVRLGVYLGLEQTSFRSGEAAKELSPQHARRRLAWAACYMADRQVSIRVGKGFWSRGPGPTSFFETKDFPSLERKRPEDPDYASVFKANLELIHIFSNAHDVLYSNREHGMRLILSGGTYVKYIDDFRTAIRGWHARYMHQNFDYPSNIRSTLLLLHDYLRLYVNAFAFQASFPRFGILEKEGNSVASLPDARFIYEAVDAAKSLLMTVNKFVDPQNCLRFMPLRYYTYIVYSSVFLYKVWQLPPSRYIMLIQQALATMSREEREAVRSMVNDTVICLTKSSTDSGHLGTRYAKLISLLWRRPPKQASKPIPEAQGVEAAEEIDYMYPANQKPLEGDLSLNAFSWLDLSAVGDFATRNNNTNHGYSEFDFTNMNQSYLDGFADSQQWYDNSSSFVF